MRGIAALAVLIFHVCLVYDLSPIFVHGWLAVDFFFALSGYVLARTYEARLHESMGPWAFTKQRFLRFWPVVLFGAAIGAPYVLAAYPLFDAIAILGLNSLLIPYFKDSELFPVNGPFWSLFYELFANILHAFLLSRLDNRKLMGLVLACGVGMTMMGFFHGGLSLGTHTDTFAAGFVRVTLSYGIGVLLFRWWRDRPPIRVAWPWTVLLGALLLVGRDPLGGFVPQLLFMLVGVPLVIAGGLRWKTRLSALGALSFPLYAAHLPVVFYCATFGVHPVLAAAISIAVASLYLALEKRLRVQALDSPRRLG